jgi:ribosomal protein S14
METGKDRKVTCIKCGDTKPRHLMKKVKDFYLCWYCFEVTMGKPDGRWIGVADKSEKLPGGFHTT